MERGVTYTAANQHLVIGRRYAITHIRKQGFTGVLLGVVPAADEDPQDAELWAIEMDTSEGSGSEWLRRAKDAQTTVTNIRPSLVLSIKEVK